MAEASLPALTKAKERRAEKMGEKERLEEQRRSRRAPHALTVAAALADDATDYA